MGEEKKLMEVPQDLQHQFEALQERASKDALSGLLNRDTSESYINQRLRSMSPGVCCALFIVDLDDFKRVNDTLGHQAGDQAIRQSAQLLSGLFRASDIVGRLGGDEFVAFLSGALTEDLVIKKAKAICQHVQLVLGEHPAINLTASVGVSLSPGGMPFDALYQAADRALYTAKRQGKHGFSIWKDSDSAPDSFTPVNTIPLTGLLEQMDSGVALVEVGEQLNVIYVSPSFCRILELDPDRVPLPIPLERITHPDDLHALEAALRAGAQERRPVEFTHRISPDAGRWSWWHIRAVRIAYNSPCPVMLVTTTDISDFKESESKLRQANERLRLAFEQTAQGLWEVDIAARSFRVYSQEGRFHLPEPAQMDFPEGLIANGWVHPNSVPRIREFAAELLAGRSQDYGNFVIQFQDTGCYGWAALSYRTVQDETGRPVRAVGVMEALPRSFLGQEAQSILSRALPESQASSLIVGLRANLTQDAVKELWVEGRDLSGQARTLSCSQALQLEAEKIFSRDDRQALAEYFDRGALLTLFTQGRRWHSAAYRRVDSGGSISWARYVIHMAADPLSQEVYLFVYLSQWEQHRHWEQAIPDAPVRDPVTGLYNPDTSRALIESLISRQQGGLCAVVLIQLGGLLRLCGDESGQLDRARNYLASAFLVALGPGCMIGQNGLDQLLVFFPEVQSKFQLRQSLEESFVFVRQALAGSLAIEGLRLVAGAVCLPPAQAGYSLMLEQASHLCQLWRNAPSDTVAIPQEDEDWSWTQLHQEKGEDQVTVHHQTEMERPLSEGERDVAFHVVSSMLSADSLDISVRGVLAQLGSYYQADRVYLLELTEDRQMVTMPYEWTNQKKNSIQQAASGMPVGRIPLLKRCMEEKAPVFLTRSHAAGRQAGLSGHAWCFTTFPLMEGEEITGFLCIENAKEHPADAALFSIIIPYLLREPQRFRGRPADAETEANGAVLRDLPNLRSYLQVIYSLSSDRYSSLGAVCLDIPSLSTINSSQGFEYGSRLLWFVSKTLADIFGPDLLFRTWDAEFVSLCPNTTQQVFTGRCARLRNTLQRRYPKALRIGCTWADGVFSGKTLVDEARAIMRCEETGGGGDLEHLNLPYGGFRSVTEAARAGRFTVFFQPKVDLRTGALLGAEALVRGLDGEGHVIPPGQFIDHMEKNGSIRELDLFVLDHTLAVMDRWREQGLGVLPVSVNFSRVTLFNPAALGSVLAIQSRYPHIPPGSVEVEITESAGSVEKSNLTAVMEQFRECGLRFGLDDFGSQYANIPIFTNVKFDTVKLDRSLIAELTGNSINRMLVRDIIQICRASGMDCVAEGVETPAQSAALTELGCVCAQGYYFDRPLPAEKFEAKYLRAGQFQAAGQTGKEEQI